MANNIYDITTSGPDPSGAGAIITSEAEWGTDASITGYTDLIVQSEDRTDEVIADMTQDQKGRTVSQLNYDTHTTITLNVIGSIGTGTSAIQPGKVISYKKNSTATAELFVVTSVTYNGQFDDKKKYSISCERFANFPAQN